MKLALAAFVLFLGCSTSVFGQQQLAITMNPVGEPGDTMVQSGTFSATSSLVPGGTCPVGQAGMRRQISTVSFNPPFEGTPAVTVGLSELDVGDGRNTRINMRVENVSNDKATIVVETWCDTNLYSAAGSFVAIGKRSVASQGKKVCSAYVPNQWRAMLSVPSSWTVADCQGVLPTVGASTYQLGCEFDDAPRWVQGGAAGGVPSRNCGW